MYSKKKRVQMAVWSCLILLLAGCRNQAGLYVTRQDETGIAEEEQTRQGAEDEQEKEEIFVQVCGAVKNPGVYRLTQGSRIFEAIELAGGITEKADIRTLNQAEILRDGQMIYVYEVGEQKQEVFDDNNQNEDSRLNLNTATAEQLMTLPGIGPSKAEDIVSYRREHGAFEKIEEIMNITGIKEGVFSKIKDLIKVY